MKKKIETKKKVVTKKKSVKNEVLSKKKQEYEGEKWGEGEYSLTTVMRDKCIVSFPIAEWYRTIMDGDLGLIAALSLKKIYNNSVYIQKTEEVWDRGTKVEYLVYEFDKKYAKKIKETELAYFMHEIKTDAKTMSDLIMNDVNNFSPKWMDGLTVMKVGEEEKKGCDKEKEEREKLMKQYNRKKDKKSN